jgi:hypothetical protein
MHQQGVWILIFFLGKGHLVSMTGTRTQGALSFGNGFFRSRSINPFGTEQGWTDGWNEDGIHGTINMTTSLLAFWILIPSLSPRGDSTDLSSAFDLGMEEFEGWGEG